jgi:hypothetical protein
MKQWQRRRTWWVLGLSAGLVGGLITAGLTPAEAAPRRYARDQDRDCIPDHRDWDRDGDGIRNSRDRHPSYPDRYRSAGYTYRAVPYRYRDSYTYTARPRARDLDRDCIPNYRDRDRDGDRVPNWRDRRPDNRRYR